MFEITNLAEFQAGLRDWLKGAETLSLNAYRGLAAYGFAYIVEETPEYTGESVSNWRMSVGAPEYSSSSGIKAERSLLAKSYSRLPVYQKQGWTEGDPAALPSGQGGNPRALSIARNSLRAGLRAVKSLDDVIYIANGTQWKGDRGVDSLENPPAGWLREVNEPGQMIGRAMSYIIDSFEVISDVNLGRLMVTAA